MRDSGLTIAVGGGKGGVGKSVVASNLAIAMAQLGFRVVLVDADLGAANQHTLFGIERVRNTIQALFDGAIQSLEEAVIPTSIPRLSLVAGTGAVLGAANIPHARKLKLIRQVHSLDADAIVIDCGAGSSFNVVDFFDMADQRLLVVTPQLVSMQNAYAFLKSAVYRSLGRVAIHAREREAFGAAVHGGDKERMAQVLERLLEDDEAELAGAMQRNLGSFSASMIGNQLEHAKQGAALLALSRMMQDFLGLDVPLRGSILLNRAIHVSVTRRRPFLAASDGGKDGRSFREIAELLLETDVTALRKARRRTLPPQADPATMGPIANHLRRFPRQSVDLPATLMLEEGGFGARLLDISSGGARLRSQRLPAQGSRVRLRFDSLPSAPLAEVLVRRVDAEREQLGVEFVSEASHQAAEEIFSSIPEGRRIARVRAAS
ncbi:MAG: P-loop NTPase [Myxococcales bacterium]|nr:P-loop NTPase [Myxococcales bacterium]